MLDSPIVLVGAGIICLASFAYLVWFVILPIAKLITGGASSQNELKVYCQEKVLIPRNVAAVFLCAVSLSILIAGGAAIKAPSSSASNGGVSQSSDEDLDVRPGGLWDTEIELVEVYEESWLESDEPTRQEIESILRDFMEEDESFAPMMLLASEDLAYQHTVIRQLEAVTGDNLLDNAGEEPTPEEIAQAREWVLEKYSD